MIGSLVLLNEFEIWLADHVAQRNFEANRKIKNSRVSDKDDFKIILEGLAAELAFCKLVNVYPSGPFDLTIKSCRRGQDYGDVVYKGQRVDVKQTHYLSGQLITPYWKIMSKADCYALMIGTMPRFTFKGFMLSSDFLTAARLKDIGYGPTYMAKQEELKEFDVLFAH